MATTNTEDLMGLRDMAEAFDLSINTVRQYRFKGLLPDPDYTVNGGTFPIWKRSTLTAWNDARLAKAAERAEAAAEKAAPAPAPEPEGDKLDEMTVKDLRKLASGAGLKGVSRTPKGELIEMLRAL